MPTDPLALPDVTDPAVRARAVARAAERSAHPDVLATIRASTPAQERSRDALARGVCVVTGQQAGLFGGPLYTLHKAASAIVDARALEAETGIPCAPVFWLQDEDHDFDEIASVGALGLDGSLHTLSVDGVPGEDGRSVGSRRLGASVVQALDVLQGLVHGLPFAEDVLAGLREDWTPDVSPARAFRATLERLTAAHGLLIVDPWDPRLQDAARPVHQLAFDQAGPIADALRAHGELLAASGRPVPVHVRDAAPLSFVHPDGRDGPRVRVEPDGDGGFRVCGSDGTLTAAQVARGPHSTSALLRPILQDVWLPTAAYVGGPGELAYLAQMPPLYAAFDLPVPLIVPRGRFALLDPSCRRLLEQLGLDPSDLALPRETLLTRHVRPGGDRPDPDALLGELTASASEVLARFRPVADGLDAGLAKSVDKTSATLHDACARLVDRYRRALALDDEVSVGRLDRLLARVQPGGAPQERGLGWATFAARHGPDRLVQAVLDAVVSFDGALRWVDP